ncbi:hypothetical protein M404DRAFT_1007651 [Pisolithus tinctorius Marx 270]|uniref:Uncharacterized protein n=1 Tax=Pisolithus tinctorius Marx 270 TaxID=870435 RepID=A0A0C3JCI2_PISTI|nr:hypothetical protein M404DRAFT_1007651 [Pisolithus tinctorius Marx 270]
MKAVPVGITTENLICVKIVASSWTNITAPKPMPPTKRISTNSTTGVVNNHFNRERQRQCILCAKKSRTTTTTSTFTRSDTGYDQTMYFKLVGTP